MFRNNFEIYCRLSEYFHNFWAWLTIASVSIIHLENQTLLKHIFLGEEIFLENWITCGLFLPLSFLFPSLHPSPFSPPLSVLILVVFLFFFVHIFFLIFCWIAYFLFLFFSAVLFFNFLILIPLEELRIFAINWTFFPITHRRYVFYKTINDRKVHENPNLILKD